ncbi:MAG: cobalamin biosynthesis protein CbiA [Phycisphaerae bacterium]|nr:cobalamin biosynthesis protein CbiA [Phycisphaerae bacterium]
MGENLEYVPQERVILIVGNFGSGKTEVAVNLAIRLSERRDVSIADLDIVNPYFRCREARKEMERFGIRVINPEGDYLAADLPIILPEIRGAVLNEEGTEGGTLIFDVGGDDVGARVLSSLADVFTNRPCTVLQVLNAKRPFTQTVEGCLRIGREIEAASRLRITGLVSNTHLLEETDTRTVLDGLKLAREVGKAAGLTVAFVTANEDLRGGFDVEKAGCPVLWIKRRMLPPWKLKSMTDRAERVLGRDPGRRTANSE